MPQDRTPPPQPSRRPPDVQPRDSREDRLARALRDNLRRRKAKKG